MNIRYTLNHLSIFGSVEVEENIPKISVHLISPLSDRTLLGFLTQPPFEESHEFWLIFEEIEEKLIKIQENVQKMNIKVLPLL